MKPNKVLIITALILLPFIAFAESTDMDFDASDFDRVEVETLHGDISATAVSGDEISMSFEHSLGAGVDNEITEALSGLLEIAKTYEGSEDVDINITEDEVNRVLKVSVEMIEEDNAEIEDIDISISLPSSIFVKLTSTNGNLEVDGNRAGFDLSTTNGNVTIENTAGTGTFDATNGNVTIDGHTGGIKGIANNGKISGVIQMPDHDGQCSLETINNDIEVSVPSTVGAKVTLSTTHGTSSISGFDVSTKKVDDDIVKTIGDGSGTIRLVTTNGDVMLKEM
ncbi:hypothetical protein JXM67_11440 [candidate division WOR-3 bacterium]|nr:hypothetical protein [candidate division WOR-3 bacterium]